MTFQTSTFIGDPTYSIRCTGDACVGDRVAFDRATFSGSFRNAKFAGAYKGAGIALAALVDGHPVDLIYLRDLLPGFEDHAGMDPAPLLSDHRLSPVIRHLEALGQVSVGMVSSWEFCEV